MSWARRPLAIRVYSQPVEFASVEADFEQAIDLSRKFGFLSLRYLIQGPIDHLALTNPRCHLHPQILLTMCPMCLRAAFSHPIPSSKPNLAFSHRNVPFHFQLSCLPWINQREIVLSFFVPQKQGLVQGRQHHSAASSKVVQGHHSHFDHY